MRPPRQIAQSVQNLARLALRLVFLRGRTTLRLVTILIGRQFQLVQLLLRPIAAPAAAAPLLLLPLAADHLRLPRPQLQ